MCCSFIGATDSAVPCAILLEVAIALTPMLEAKRNSRYVSTSNVSTCTCVKQLNHIALVITSDYTIPWPYRLQKQSAPSSSTQNMWNICNEFGGVNYEGSLALAVSGKCSGDFHELRGTFNIGCQRAVCGG